MADAETIACVVRDGYDARRRGDKAALQTLFAPGATFRMVGQPDLARGLPVTPVDALESIGELIDAVTFHDVEIVNLLTDGKTAMIQLRFELSAGGDRVHTEACDVWEFDEAGRITSITQFVDTLLVAHVMSEPVA